MKQIYEASQRRYETRDFYLACFLRCRGYELLDLRTEVGRKVFVFRDRATRRDDVIAFYGDAISVPPLAFVATIKDMKGCSIMAEPSDAPSCQRPESGQVRKVLDRLERLIVEGLKHGFFDCSITCEIAAGGKRHLVIRAGKSHKFTIPAEEVPH
jgi:hypothetical protein